MNAPAAVRPAVHIMSKAQAQFLKDSGKKLDAHTALLVELTLTRPVPVGGER